MEATPSLIASPVGLVFVCFLLIVEVGVNYVQVEFFTKIYYYIYCLCLYLVTLLLLFCLCVVCLFVVLNPSTCVFLNDVINWSFICLTAGLPDLVPDLDTLRNSLYSTYYISRVPIYYLTCAREEKCLSSSAVGASPNSARFLLRFDSLTMNWGTTDFVPHRDRSEWQFHTCHNHFHSFEAFIHYDLLDASTHAKVAEGHKASFCLEDSTCKNGVSRYCACWDACDVLLHVMW